MRTVDTFRLLTFALLTRTSFGAGVSASTSTEWRDDEKNIIVVRELNRAYERLLFSREYEGVLDQCPFKIDWRIGPNLPVPWKGGVSGIFGEEIALVGGLWMPGYQHRAYSYHTKEQVYREIPPPPFKTEYTQGAFDGKNLYVVGGRVAGRRVAKLSRELDGVWKWTELVSLPESESRGRWLAAVAVVPGRWLFLVAGHPTGTQSEVRTEPALPDWRLPLDKPGAQWEPMAPYPGGQRALLASAVLRDQLYVFGGSHPEPVMRSIFQNLVKEYALFITPYAGVPQYRDGYCYHPAHNRWRPLRNLPFPISGGTGVALQDRYILIMGTTETKTLRVGKTDRSGLSAMASGAKSASEKQFESFWTGYNDVILCYDVERDNYSRVGVMPYGVATCPWLSDGTQLYGFGGEPYHRFNLNTENVLQIGTIEPNQY